MTDFFWTWENEAGELFDGEYATKKAAHDAANERYAEICEDQSVRGEEWEADIHLVCFSYSVDGEIIIDQREAATVNYIHEDDDTYQHGTWHSL